MRPHMLEKSDTNWRARNSDGIPSSAFIKNSSAEVRLRNFKADLCKQNISLCHEMANVLSILELRLYIVKKTHDIDDEETEVFDQCMEQLYTLLSSWKRLMVDNGNTEP